MFENDEKIERKYRDKAAAYADGILHGGLLGVVGSWFSFLLLLISGAIK